MSSGNSIDILAKGNGREAIVSLRRNELISNLRALVAVRFEQAIPRIVLIFGGQVLRDVGTIDSLGIISGVTVHVVCRPEPSSLASIQSPQPDRKTLSLTSKERLIKTWNAVHIAHLLDEPGLLRSLLQADPRIQCLLEENVMLRHYLSSDRNLHELLSAAFGPAKEELSRRRDLHILRMESAPGGNKFLGRLQVTMRQTYENNIAMAFQQPSQGSQDGSNPQRGFENKLPLPNPWRRLDNSLNVGRAHNVTVHLRQKCDQVVKTLQLGNIGKSIRVVRKLNDSGGQARRILERRGRSNQSVGNPPHISTSNDDATETRIESSDFPTGSEQCYRTEMQQLCQMGYTNRVRNVYALQISLGNVASAIRLLDHWNRSEE
ncbi:hypothetical protein KR018_000147 [Drosophila ironensis]|nr:hypothetical protein KR018_000147 [Drosophila ironensis]